MKARTIEVSWKMLQSLLTQGSDNKVKLEGIPAGARILAIYNDFSTQKLSVVVEHNSFDDIIEGSQIPKMQPVIVGMSMADGKE